MCQTMDMLLAKVPNEHSGSYPYLARNGTKAHLCQLLAKVNGRTGNRDLYKSRPTAHLVPGVGQMTLPLWPKSNAIRTACVPWWSHHGTCAALARSSICSMYLCLRQMALMAQRPHTSTRTWQPVEHASGKVNYRRPLAIRGSCSVTGPKREHTPGPAPAAGCCAY